MIKEVKMYQCVCDNCGCEYKENGEPTAFDSKDDSYNAALADGWVEYKKGIYCPDCCEYDEKDDCYKPIKD